MRANLRDLGAILRVYAGKIPDLRIPVNDFDHAGDLKRALRPFIGQEVLVQGWRHGSAPRRPGKIVGFVAVVQLDRAEEPDLPVHIEGQETLG